MSRSIGIMITIVWLACMAALIQRDVMPFWRAQDPPSQQIPDGNFQVGMTNSAGRRVGTTWVTTIHTRESSVVHSTTRLDLKELSSLLPFAGDLFMSTELTFSPAGKMDNFAFRLESPALSARVTGTRYDREFACIAQIGSITQTMALDGEVSKYLGDSLRPFTHLKGLHVGQSWRLRLIDPLALLQGSGAQFTTKLVKVTAREPIDHLGSKIESFRIETDGTVAWADDAGRVLRQEVHVPLLGRWVITDEPYDDRAKQNARRAMMNLREEQVIDRSHKNPTKGME